MLKRFTPWVPLILFLFALLVRFITVRLFQFDGLYGQDSFSYFNYSLDLHQALLAGRLPPDFFWPIGYPMLVVIMTTIIGNPATAGQLVSIITSALIAPLVYLIVREYEPKAVVGGIIAGLLAGLASQPLLSSVSFMSDAAALFWATLSAWAMIRYSKNANLGWLALTAVTFALAILTRWAYGLLVVPWALSGIFTWRAAHFNWRQILQATLVAVGLGVAILGTQFISDIRQGELSHTGDLEVVGWDPANMFRRNTSNTDGDFEFEYTVGVYNIRPTFHPAYIFPLFFPFLLLSLWAIRRHPPALIVLPVGWFLVVYLFLAGIAWQNWRFPLTFFSPLLVLVGLGIHWVWQRLQPGWQKLLLAGCAVALVGSAAFSIYDIGRFTTQFNGQQAMTAVVADTLPPDATLIAFDLTATLQHYTEIETLELYLLNQADLQQVVEDQTSPTYLIMDPVKVGTQWAEMDVGRNIRWLQSTYQVTEVKAFESFVLYKID